MNEAEIKKIIFEELKKIAPDTEPEKLNQEDNIRSSLDIDSFDALRFIVCIKEKLGVEIPEEDYGKTGTLKDLLAYLKDKMPDKKAE